MKIAKGGDKMTEPTVDATYQCRRKKKRTYELKTSSVMGVIKPIVWEPEKNIRHLPECATCGYGATHSALKSRTPAPGKDFEYYDFKTCKLTLVEQKPHQGAVL